MALGQADLVDYYMSLERRVARLERTSSTSNNQTDTSYVGLLNVTGLTLSSQLVVSTSNEWVVYMTFTWTAVTLDSNIITDDPVAGYYTSWTRDGTNWTGEVYTNVTTATIGPIQQGQTIQFRVRTVTSKGTLGNYSSVSVSSTTDNVAPAQTSTPSFTPYLGQARVYWDGKNVSNGAMPGDLQVAEIHVSTSGISFTPTAATLVDVFYPGGGYYTITGLTYGTTYYCRLVAVDSVGNRSPSSTGASVVPVQAADGDIASLNIGKLVAGTLSADMTVSARIKTANTGARVELNSTGLKAYDSSNTNTVNIDAATGSITATGTFQTGTTGRRMILDPSGYSTLYIYPTTGSNYAYINAPDAGAGGSLASIGVNSGYWNNGGVDMYGRTWLFNGAGVMEIIKYGTQVAWGGYSKVTETEALVGVKKDGQTAEGYMRVANNKSELYVKGSDGVANSMHVSNTQAAIITGGNDPCYIDLHDGTLSIGGKIGEYDGNYSLFKTGESSFGSGTGGSISWGATMASQMDTVLTVEAGMCKWVMTGSSSTGWSYSMDTNQSSIVNFIAIRR